ncbi:unnamed protein product [Brugia timori]|uniref:Uncharacterized protein n=1 Tax=Brugia timori TaxID=42155 RepID=A0A0R3R670_9BILA|nr:unnamed protein product [Brugia timori]
MKDSNKKPIYHLNCFYLVSQNNKSLSLKKKETDGSEMKKDASNTEIKKQVAVVVPLITGKTKNGNGQESNERISTKKAESLTKPKTDSMKANEKIQEVITQEESLPEIKEGIMEIADDDDPRYKTLYIFMDKKFDIFGPDKRKSGQPEIGTMKNISDEEFAAKIEEIKARYETIAKKDQRIEINWDTLFVSVFWWLKLPINNIRVWQLANKNLMDNLIHIFQFCLLQIT